MQTQETAQAAKAEAGAVVGTVKDETKNVAREVQGQARNALHQVRDDVRQRADDEATKFASTLHDAGRQLTSMADAAPDQGLAASLAREGGNLAEQIAGRLDLGGLDAVMADVRSWARRSPGMFLFGAAVTGFVAGRVLRNVAGDGDSDGNNAYQRASNGGVTSTSTGMNAGLYEYDAAQLPSEHADYTAPTPGVADR